MSFSVGIESVLEQCISSVKGQLYDRAEMAAHVMKGAALDVLKGQRSGRVYRSPLGGRYTASAPGEPPAWRSGTLAKSWIPVKAYANPARDSFIPYAGYMEHGTPGGKIAPRPFAEKIVEKAMPEVLAIYSQPFQLP